MECFFDKNIFEKENIFKLSKEENAHLKVLRLKQGDQVLVTNGFGAMFSCRIISSKNFDYELEKIEDISNILSQKILPNLMIAIIDNRERTEFLIEKATELGLNKIYFVKSEFSQTNKINFDRLNTKAISAMKQSNRNKIPEIIIETNLFDTLKKIQQENEISTVYILDQFGEKIIDLFNNKRINPENISKSLFLVGPEGGFSENEKSRIQLLNESDFNVIKISIGDSILRTETAAIALLSIINSIT